MFRNSPAFLERSVSGVIQVSADSLLQERRVIFLMDSIDQEYVNRVIQQIVILNGKTNEPITLVLGSPGGDIQQGLALIDVMASSKAAIRTIALGLSASMSAVILAAGTPGYRYCTEHSRIMIHEPLLANGISGSCSSIQEAAKHILEKKTLINSMLCQFTKRSYEEIEKATAYDHFYSAQEAVEFGLVDHVADQGILMNLLGGVKDDALS